MKTCTECSKEIKVNTFCSQKCKRRNYRRKKKKSAKLNA